MAAGTITFYALGTANIIRFFREREKKAAEEAAGRVIEIERRMSAFLPGSDLSRIRDHAGGCFQRIHEDTFLLLRKAVGFGAVTQGVFDLTVRPLVRLWGINKKGDFIPSETEIRKELALVDYRSVRLDREMQSCRLAKEGQSIDLGGIAKGYAADEARRILKENGVRSALINLGGNISAVGNRPDGRPWKIGIQNPVAPRGEFAALLSVTDEAVVTSGCNERFFVKDGVCYHHILDPRTGRPAHSSVLSVTAVCGCSSDADALTTACFILGPEKSFPLLREFRAEAVFIMEDQSAIVTRGLKDHIFFQRGVRLHETA